MENDIKIAQVIGMIPNITEEQVTALGTPDSLDSEQVSQASANHGFTADRWMVVVSLDAPFPVQEMVYQTILGILASNDDLTAKWREVFGEFKDVPEAVEEHPLLALDGETGVITNAATGEVVGQAPTIEENLASQGLGEVPHIPTEEELTDLGSPDAEEVEPQLPTEVLASGNFAEDVRPPVEEGAI